MIMKENHIATATFCDAESQGKETNPKFFGVKEMYRFVDSPKGVEPMQFEGNGGNEKSKSKIVVGISNDDIDDSGRVDSLTNEVPDELSHVSGLERDEDYGEKMLSCPSLSDVGEFILHKESEPGDSVTLPITKVDLPEMDKNQCSNKNVLGCQWPELIVCDKKINDQSVKDIWIDEGMPTKDKISNGSCKGDQSGISFSQIPSDNFHCSGEEGVDNECITSNRLTMMSLESTNRFGENDSENAEVNDKKVLFEFMPKSPPDSSFDRASFKNCDVENSTQEDEAIRGTSGLIDSDIDSFANSKLPVRQLSTRRSLRSLFNSFDGKEGKFMQPLGQISPGNDVSESPTSLLAEVEPTTSNQSDNILSNSNLDERGGIKNLIEQPVESRDVDARVDGNAGDSSGPRIIQSTNIRDPSTGAVEEQALPYEHVHSSSDTPQVPCNSSNESRTKHAPTESSDRESLRPNELSAGNELETSASTKNHSIEPNVMKHDLKNSNDASAVSRQLLYTDEESSFPVAGLITYSGPIAYSGSLSHRSDGSATSGKSFAFPILPSEWNSSPVRMAKADRRYYQKQKSWKSCIFCCTFYRDKQAFKSP